MAKKIIAATSSNLSAKAKKLVASRKAERQAKKIAATANKTPSLPGKAGKAVSVVAVKAVKGKLVNKAVKAAPKAGKAVGGKASPKDKAVAKAAAKAAQTGVRPDTAKGRVYAMAQRKNGVALEDVVTAGISINLVAARALIGDLRRMGYTIESIGDGAYKA